MIDTEMTARIADAKIIAVLTVNDPERAVPLAEALLAGNVRAIELTLRTPRALEALEAVTVRVPDMLVGAGTVLTVRQVEQVKQAGAALAVAPGFNPEIVVAADAIGLPFGPGVMTPSEIEGAVALGNRVLKFYHAGVAGGLKALRSMAGPYNHLGLKYIPLGGVNPGNLAEWAADPMILAVGGSWIAPPDLIDAADWKEITRRAAEAANIVAQAAGNGGG